MRGYIILHICFLWQRLLIISTSYCIGKGIKEITIKWLTIATSMAREVNKNQQLVRPKRKIVSLNIAIRSNFMFLLKENLIPCWLLSNKIVFLKAKIGSHQTFQPNLNNPHHATNCRKSKNKTKGRGRKSSNPRSAKERQTKVRII